MASTTPPQGLADLFELSLPEGAGLERRKMFGCPCAFVNGNMFAGAYRDVTFVRLPPSLRAELEADYAARPFEPRPGFQMRAYTELPDDIVEDEARYAEVLRAAYVFTSALPPKTPRPSRKGRA